MKRPNKLHAIMALLLGLAVFGCSEQQRKATIPAATDLQSSGPTRIRAVQIIPSEPTSSSTLEADVGFSDTESARVSYQWLNDGVPIPGAITSSLDNQYVHKGDFISVQIQVSQPNGSKVTAISDSVSIKNSPPVVHWVAIAPRPATSNDDLRARLDSRDWDGDTMSLTYEWRVNGETIVGQEGPELASTNFSREDRVQVTVTPYDDTDFGTPVQAEIVIENSPPEIVSQPPGKAEEGLYRYAVRAVDVDGDPVQFSLHGESPEDMAINASTGVLTWDPESSEEESSYSFVVIAEDPEGGKTFQQISLTVLAR
ncbi:MAG: hypothetical protein JSU72_01205 [Deltaproteobacteria bacterium]|nr:MAG: hypothetical protein JSU72_01205 [Deltaproteobacteria bacterium]